MEVYRLSRQKYASSLSGEGAAIRGGRWNSKGVKIMYTAANRALAMAEVAVHFTYSTLANDYMMLTIELPDDISIGVLHLNNLPLDWNSFPHVHSTQKFGDVFVKEGIHLLLKVPSVVVSGDFNYLINPMHPDFRKIKITEQLKFPFDRRLFKNA